MSQETGRHRLLYSQPAMTVISVETKYFPSSRPSSPALVVQVTCLANSYMVWVGVTEGPEENAGGATSQGHLGKDWVVAMPPWKVRAHGMEKWMASI
jgi:hypothetical protein